ncbi:protein ELC-like [Mangifera indica]|uniref:protein ELC-like n=1 Tax=Mangifera indica TaxID=29780 RepID=UPI001CFC377D|nr:protein ELC-like [Mangifera indica]
MAPTSSIEFIDTALSCATSPFALSYTDSKQKWVIRKHLLSLFQDFPTFIPSNDSFTHNDGTTVNLLNAAGYLRVCSSSPPIHLTIWVHENYPFMPPMVFISPNAANHSHHLHPFVDSCGGITSAYLQTWSYPGHNLADLVRNLVKIFSHATGSTFTHPSFVSKREAVDRLSGMLHYDVAAAKTTTAREIEELSILQLEMKKRAGDIDRIVAELEMERKKLKERAMELGEKGDVLRNWLAANDPTSFQVMNEIENAFEAIDEGSKIVVENLAADNAIEDVIYAMDKAVEGGVVQFDVYMRQVRMLAREQFFHRYVLVTLKGSNILI